LNRILSALPAQWRTLQVLDVSQNEGYIDPIAFSGVDWNFCMHIKQLSLCGLKLLPLASDMSLLPLPVLLSHNLEQLHIDQTKLNDETIQTLVE
jgi:hypothetical protein